MSSLDLGVSDEGQDSNMMQDDMQGMKMKKIRLKQANIFGFFYGYDSQN